MERNELETINALIETLNLLAEQQAEENKGGFSVFNKVDKKKADYYIGKLKIEFAIALLKKIKSLGLQHNTVTNNTAKATTSEIPVSVNTAEKKLYNQAEDNDTLGIDKDDDKKDEKKVAITTSADDKDIEKMKKDIEDLQKKVNQLGAICRQLSERIDSKPKTKPQTREAVVDEQKNVKNENSAPLNQTRIVTQPLSPLEKKLVEDYAKEKLSASNADMLMGLTKAEINSRLKNNYSKQSEDGHVTLLQKVTSSGDESYIAKICDKIKQTYYIFPIQGKMFTKNTIWNRAYGAFFSFKNEEKIGAFSRKFKVLRPAVVELRSDGYYQLSKMGVIEVLQ